MGNIKRMEAEMKEYEINNIIFSEQQYNYISQFMRNPFGVRQYISERDVEYEIKKIKEKLNLNNNKINVIRENMQYLITI